MNYKSILFYLGINSLLVSLLSVLNILYSIYFNFILDINSYLITFLFSFIIGSIFLYIGNIHSKNISLIDQITFIIASKFLFAAELTLFMLLEFALSPIWVWLFISEMPTLYTIIGGSVVVLAVGYRSFSELNIYSNNRRKIPQNPL